MPIERREFLKTTGKAATVAAASLALGAKILGANDKVRVAICGTHGKTTTTAMAAHALHECGRRPSYVIGGELRSSGVNAAWDDGEWLVVEADESDRSFLKLTPDVAVVTNVELDHHSTYRSTRDLEMSFERFLRASHRTSIMWEEVPLEVVEEPVALAEAESLAARRCRHIGQPAPRTSVSRLSPSARRACRVYRENPDRDARKRAPGKPW